MTNTEVLTDQLRSLSDFGKYYTVAESSNSSVITLIYQDDNGKFDCRGNITISVIGNKIEILIGECVYNYNDQVLRHKMRFIADILEDQFKRISYDTSVVPRNLFEKHINNFCVEYQK